MNVYYMALNFIIWFQILVEGCAMTLKNKEVENEEFYILQNHVALMFYPEFFYQKLSKKTRS